MVISVTTFETRKTTTVRVNGHAIRREHTTKIYVIEPMDDKDKNVATRVEQGQVEEISQKGSRRAAMWIMAWLLWLIILLFTFR